jgi:predicted transcriptional regulator
MKGFADMGPDRKGPDRIYQEFIMDLGTLGELQSVANLISQFLRPDSIISEEMTILSDSQCSEVIAVMRTLWQEGWIGLLEIKRTRKNERKKIYILKVCLEEIADYFRKEYPSSPGLTSSTPQLQNAAIAT